jgi:tRNA G18 (ribose-2'-O)-methylase SpoU
MLETPKEFNNNELPGSVENESKKQRRRELVERHALLDNEMGNLIAEEGALIAKNSEDDADDKRLQEINRREIDILEEERRIVEAMSHSQEPSQQ